MLEKAPDSRSIENSEFFISRIRGSILDVDSQIRQMKHHVKISAEKEKQLEPTLKEFREAADALLKKLEDI